MSFDITATGLVMIENETYYISSVPKQEKLITKHRKAAKMIGDLLGEKKRLYNQITEFAFFSAGLDLKIISKNQEIKKLKDENKKLTEQIKEDNKIYKEFRIEKLKLQGEIRALERTIDKLIEVRK